MKLLAFDLDGTILSNHTHLSQKNHDALMQLALHDIILVPATGRMHSFLPKDISSISEIRYIISANGASIYDRTADLYLHQSLIPCEKAQEVFHLLEAYPIHKEIYTGSCSLTTQTSLDHAIQSGFPKEKAFSLKKKFTLIPDFLQHLNATGLQPDKINLPYVPETIYRSLWEALERIEGLKLTSSLPSNIEINDLHTNKGHALCQLAAHLNICQTDTIAIGDNSNDVEMLTYAAVSIAMGNATDDAKAAAKYITTPCETDGFAFAVQHFMLQPEIRYL